MGIVILVKGQRILGRRGRENHQQTTRCFTRLNLHFSLPTIGLCFPDIALPEPAIELPSLIGGSIKVDVRSCFRLLCQQSILFYIFSSYLIYTDVATSPGNCNRFKKLELDDNFGKHPGTEQPRNSTFDYQALTGI